MCTTAERLRREKRAVGFDQQAVERHPGGDHAEFGGRTKCHHAGETEMAAQFDGLRRLGRRAGKGVQHGGQRAAAVGLAERVERIADALAGVHDERQSEGLGQTYVPVEEVPLEFPGGRIAVPVETGFTDGLCLAGGDQSRDPVPFVGLDFVDVVGMNAGGIGDTNFAGCEFGGRLAVGGPCADHRHPDDARGPGAGEHLGQIGAVAHRIEMAVAVKEFHCESPGQRQDCFRTRPPAAR